MRTTSTWKKIRHTFYLVQPVLQFVLLAFAVTALSRCSPLSPSTDKLTGKSVNPLKSSSSESLAAAIDEDAFEQNLQPIGVVDVQFQTEEEFQEDQKLAQSIFSDVQSFVNSERIGAARKEFPPVALKITGEALDALAQGREARLPLTADAELLLSLKKNPGAFNAFVALVGAQSFPQSPHIRIAVQASVIDGQNAFLQLTHQSNETPEARVQALHIFSNMARSAKFLAVTLQ